MYRSAYQLFFGSPPETRDHEPPANCRQGTEYIWRTSPPLIRHTLVTAKPISEDIGISGYSEEFKRRDRMITFS